MDALIRTYEGQDIVISRDQIEQLGIKPGDKVVIRPQVNLELRTFSPEEIARREAILDRLAGSWTAEDEEAFRKFRQEMWATWQPRNWS